MAVVGVTGHRILTEIETLDHAIEQVLLRIEQKFPDESLRLLTQLSDGADRFVAEHFFKHPGWRVVAVLPMSLQQYLDDFSDDSRKVFLRMLQQCIEVIHVSEGGSRDEAYEAAGTYIVEHSDVMLSIWDGNVEQGRGGTGAIVHRARQRGIPLAWIHAGNRKPGTLEPTSLGLEQGTITFERFD